MKLNYTVTEKNERLKANKGEDGKKFPDTVYDLGSYEGRITLSVTSETGEASFYDTIDIMVNDKEEFDKFKLGAILPITIGLSDA